MKSNTSYLMMGGKALIIMMVAVVSGLSVSNAKYIRFSVDMTGQTVSTNGVHVSGDFQAIAGFEGGDWQSGTTEMIKETGTDIYSVVVNIPAFAKYEYKFLNGNQWYDVEFVPEPSRVGYDFNDSRWVYLDSLSNDTTNVEAVLFSQNAPSGKRLVRLLVDMQLQDTVSSNGVHLEGSFQDWAPAKTSMYSFGAGVYETIIYLTDGTYEYKYINGNSSGEAEEVPAGCAADGNREMVITGDTVFSAVCFSECTDCATSSVDEDFTASAAQLYPNPAADYSNIILNTGRVYNITVCNNLGISVANYENYRGATLWLNTCSMVPGVYYVSVHCIDDNSVLINKLLIQ